MTNQLPAKNKYFPHIADIQKYEAVAFYNIHHKNNPCTSPLFFLSVVNYDIHLIRQKLVVISLLRKYNGSGDLFIILVLIGSICSHGQG